MKRLSLRLIPLLVAAVVLTGGSPGQGTQTCGASAVRLSSSSLRTTFLVIYAPTGNMGDVYIGNSSVSSTNSIPLDSGDSFSYPPQGNSATYDLTAIWLACTVPGDTVRYNYWQ